MSPKMRIMIVDDDPFVGAAMNEILKHEGFQTHLFNDPEKALAAFGRQPDAFCMILSDYNMPGLDGLELIRATRSIQPGLPAMLVSAMPPENAPDDIRTMGKPVRYDELIAQIRRMLESHGDHGMAEPAPPAPQTV